MPKRYATGVVSPGLAVCRSTFGWHVECSFEIRTRRSFHRRDVRRRCDRRRDFSALYTIVNDAIFRSTKAIASSALRTWTPVAATKACAHPSVRSRRRWRDALTTVNELAPIVSSIAI